MSILGTRRPVRLRSVFVALWLATLALISGVVSSPIRADSVPTVIIYPLIAMGDLGDPDAGGRFANFMAINIEREGGITVKPFVAGTERKNYLTAARGQGADYYVTGFLTPIGEEVTLVVQIVNVNSGTVMWSQTAFVKTFNDAGAQADAVRHAILAREGRYLAELNAPTPSPHDTEQPGKKANETTGISLLGHHRRSGATPAPSDSPASPPAGVGTPSALGSGVPTPGRVVAATMVPARPTAAPPTSAPTSVPTARAVSMSASAAHPSVTPPPAFGRGSAFAALRSSVARSPRTTALMSRFAPTGAFLASLEGDEDPLQRAIAIDALVRGLHAHDASNPAYRVSNLSQSSVRTHAENLCITHSGIGSLYLAHLEIEPATASQPITAALELTASDCRGVLTAQSAAVVSDTTVPSAIRRAVSTAVTRLTKRR